MKIDEDKITWYDRFIETLMYIIWVFLGNIYNIWFCIKVVFVIFLIIVFIGILFLFIR